MAIELPDFDKMLAQIQKIKNLSIEVSKLDLQIRFMEAVIFRQGKEQGMAVNFIENAYKYTGFNDELKPLREELSEKKAELEAARFELELDKSIIEVFRTISANERIGLQ